MYYHFIISIDTQSVGPTVKSVVALQASPKLLLVCRQLHDEAAFLPFSANGFAFDGTNSDGHDMFVASLGSLQQRAIRHIAFRPQLFYRQSPFNPLEKLCNVQEIDRFLSDDICGSIAGDEVPEERMAWLKSDLGVFIVSHFEVCVS